ncbi:MAG TPA: hypothetical protein VJ855_05345, partial [Marinilabiliaceae bacterium]|nr:hypothetical protein [Marinilabiliaceae bacterium]
MGKTLTEIAQLLKKSTKKVQLIYAFNGVGKTRLSREFIKPKESADEQSDSNQDSYFSNKECLYYNALTEDLFYWDNDSNGGTEPEMYIRQNPFIDWIIGERGQDQNIIANFQRYTDEKLTPSFIEKEISNYHDGKRIIKKTFPEVNFSFTRGDERSENIKISKGEERNFIWSIFFTLLNEIAGILSEKDLDKRDDNQFDSLKYVFIDDPVSSLDENHLIEMAIDLAQLIKSLTHTLSFIITTHNPLFYNVLH